MANSVNLSKQTVNLSKNQVINLSKSSDGLKNIMIGLGWSDAKTLVTKNVTPSFMAKLFGMKPKTVTIKKVTGFDYDLDAWVGFVNNGRIDIDKDICFYGRKTMDNNGRMFIGHSGDDLTGGGDVNVDNERIFIDLDSVPTEYDEIIIGVTIYKGKDRGQRFGDIKNTFVRVVDIDANFEICRYAENITDEYCSSITFFVGGLYKQGNEWYFRADGIGTEDESIFKAATNYIGRR